MYIYIRSAEYEVTCASAKKKPENLETSEMESFLEEDHLCVS
jgi:hypothetical protein